MEQQGLNRWCYLVCNEASVVVGTNNPDWNSYFPESHTGKFNVAVTLTGKEDFPGFLDLGLRYTSTNANYIVWDNPTLYYFGNMSEEQALDAMAEIDICNIVAIADTLTEGIVMNADTLNELKNRIEYVKSRKTTAATLWEDSEDLFWQMGLARKSASDYASLKRSLDFAKKVYAGTWTDAYKDFYYDGLTYAIEDAEIAYEEKEADRAELTQLRRDLDMYAGFMRLDSVNIALTELRAFIRDGAFTDLPGDFTSDQKASLEALAKEVVDTMGVVEAYGAVDPRPQDVYPYMQKIYDAIEEVKSNPYDGVLLMTLPQSTVNISGRKPLEGTELDDLGRYSYTSPLIEFKEPVELIRLTVSKVTSASQIYFCLSSMEFFDATGTEIELTAANFYSNADHNSVSGGKDGQSYEGLVDDKDNTYFHSDWSGKITEPHYLEVTFPNGGYDAVSFKIVSRANNQNHQFPAEIVVTTPVVKRGLIAVEAALNDAKALNPYAGTDPGFYTHEFTALMDAMRQAEAILANYTSEEDCNNVVKALRAEIDNFKNDDTKTYGLPDPEKTYRLVSAFPSFYEKQGVEKAITVHAANTTLWWENAGADSLNQAFKFEPILNEDEEPYFELVEEGKDENEQPIMVPYYCYTLKNVATGLYVDSTFVDNKIHLVEVPTDTVKLKCLGRGQWNIMVRGNVFHCGDHNSGNVGGTYGNYGNYGYYGGTWGVSSGICSYGGGLDGASAWFIREAPELPLTVLVEGAAFKSECFHFDPSNTITLTADKACAFDGLTLYDLYGSVIAFDSVAVTGKTAVISLEKTIVACSFAFNNAEGVSSVEFNAFVPQIQLLQKAYDEAVAVAPIEGNDVGQYADLIAYKIAIAVAEELIANGGSGEEMLAAIEALEEAVAGLIPNMPKADKVYCIYSALPFEENLGYKMVLASEGSSNLRWKNENALDLQQYWQFEPASVEQLKEAGMDTTKCAFYIKNLATKKYLGELNVTDGVTTALEDTVASAMPFAITILGVDTEVALDGLGQSGKRLHAYAHGSGKGTGANIIYWYSGAGTASAWNIVDAGDAYKISDLHVQSLYNEVKVLSDNGGCVSGSGKYIKDSEVTVSATPNKGYRFVEWSDGSTANPYTFTLVGDTVLRAKFAPDLNVYMINDSDSEFSMVENLLYEKITYVRLFNNTNWQALYVPFEIPLDSLKTGFEVAYINDMHQFDDDNNGTIDRTEVEAIKIVEGTLKANYPYLIKAKSIGEKSIVVADATLYATEENSVDCSSVFTNYTFTGSYSTLSGEELAHDEGYYVLSDGMWQPLAEGASLGAFRIYLKIESRDGNNAILSQAPIRMRVVGDEENEDDAAGIENSTGNGQQATVYDLQGRKVLNTDNLKGIYIVDGKKVVIK